MDVFALAVVDGAAVALAADGAGSTALAVAGGVALAITVVEPAAETGVALGVDSTERALVARSDVPSFGGWVPEQAASRMIAACQRMRAA